MLLLLVPLLVNKRSAKSGEASSGLLGKGGMAEGGALYSVCLLLLKIWLNS